MINSARLTAAAKTFRAMFFQALMQSPAQERQLLNLLSMEVPSTGDTESYEWLGEVPGMSEWLGDRALKQLAAYGFTITNKNWANGIEVSRTIIEDDKLGLIRPRIQGLADAYWRKRWELVLGLLTGAKTGTCYDGKYFVAADHAEGSSGAQSNIETDLLDADAYAEARYTMYGLKDDEGNRLGITPTHLLVCPALEGEAREILLAQRNAAGADNVWANTAQLVIVPGMDAGGLTANKAWALADLSKPIKPFIDQLRKPVEFTAVENPDADSVFMRNKFRYGADYRGNAGYGMWQLIRVSDGSGS